MDRTTDTTDTADPTSSPDPTRHGPGLEVISAGAAQGLLAALGDRLAAALGGPVAATFAPVGGVDEWLRAGRPCDVVITSQPHLAALAEAGLVVAGSAAPIGSVDTAIAVRTGCPAPDVADAGALGELIRRATRIHCNDPDRATAGAHFARVLDRLDVREQVRDRLAIHPNGAATMRALAGDRRPGAIGCAQATEIAAEPGVRLAGALAGEFALSTLYVAFVRTGTPRAARARRCVAMLCGDDARPARRAAGFGEPGFGEPEKKTPAHP